MKYTDIAIIGGGLAGSTAAAMLGGAGIPTALIDRSARLPREKISGDEQVDRFYRTGIADSVLRSVIHDGENCWPRFVARFGALRQMRTGTDAESNRRAYSSSPSSSSSSSSSSLSSSA